MADTCSTCKYFLARVNGTAAIGVPVVGECRRLPPTPLILPNGAPVMIIASVGSDHWCGEHKAAVLVRA